MKQKNFPKKWLKIAAGGAAGVCAVSYGGIRFMMDLALNRHKPRIMKDLSFLLSKQGEEMSAYSKALDDASEELRKRPNETVTMVNREGMVLTGHWMHAENPRRIVITMHGWRSSWHWDYGLMTPFLLEEGCSLLHTEQRAQRGSEGDYMSFGILERYDCVDWVNYVAEQYPDMPIYLLGISMGATTVLMASGEELPENVRGIIADCGFTAPHDIWKTVSETTFHLPYKFKRITNLIFRRKLKVSADAYSTIDAMETNRIPVMFVHGEADTFVPCSMTLANYDACIAEKKLLTVPGAQHGGSYYTDRAAYEAMLKEFWAAHD